MLESDVCSRRSLQSCSRRSWWVWSRPTRTSSTTCCVGNSGNRDSQWISRHQIWCRLCSSALRKLQFNVRVSALSQRQSPDGGERQRVHGSQGHGGVSGLSGSLQWQPVPTGAPVTAFPPGWERRWWQPDQRGLPERPQTEPEQEAAGHQIRYYGLLEFLWMWGSEDLKEFLI